MNAGPASRNLVPAEHYLDDSYVTVEAIQHAAGGAHVIPHLQRLTLTQFGSGDDLVVWDELVRPLWTVVADLGAI